MEPYMAVLKQVFFYMEQYLNGIHHWNYRLDV